MTKFFLDIKNLKVIWGNIDDLYLRKNENIKIEADIREIEHDIDYTEDWDVTDVRFIELIQFLSNDGPKIFSYQDNKYDIIGRHINSETEFLAIVPYNGKFKALLMQIILQDGDNNNQYKLRWVDYSHKNIDYDFIKNNLN